ncbi:MAG: 4-hydroxy-tetrahydrodipicolinate reductase [Chloroflexi bacterium]|nr:4-hydroxy-tetrahydrodipicolinate reductase [Chloroflexota bacterium]
MRAAVSGTGEMGRLVLATLEAEPGVEVVGVLEPLAAQTSVRPEHYAAASGASYPLSADPAALFRETGPDLVVDFTDARATARLIDAVIECGVRPVIGTSGVPAEEVARLRSALSERRLGGVVAANFALGAVVQMYLARVAGRFFDAAELIELHHDRKADAPSGTALATARGMREERGSDFSHPDPELEHEGAEGARGAVVGGVGIHSVRLPGLVAHQEVILGGRGQTLSLRHDSTGRESFMPGVLLAVHAVMEQDGLVEGLDSLVGLS